MTIEPDKMIEDVEAWLRDNPPAYSVTARIDAAVKAERAAVVKWLREEWDALEQDPADGIEDGEHLK